MDKTKRRWGAVAALLALTAALALAGAATSAAHAQGLTRQQLEAQGWTCVPFPFPPATPIRHSCFNPGQGRPIPGQPDPPPSYTFLAFAYPSGDFIGTGHLIRGDLYAGQRCAPGDDLYVYRAPIGYYECLH
jgi:hypothetical protein